MRALFQEALETELARAVEEFQFRSGSDSTDALSHVGICPLSARLL